jgi:hypothetical protein
MSDTEHYFYPATRVTRRTPASPLCRGVHAHVRRITPICAARSPTRGSCRPACSRRVGNWGRGCLSLGEQGHPAPILGSRRLSFSRCRRGDVTVRRGARVHMARPGDHDGGHHCRPGPAPLSPAHRRTPPDLPRVSGVDCRSLCPGVRRGTTEFTRFVTGEVRETKVAPAGAGGGRNAPAGADRQGRSRSGGRVSPEMRPGPSR